MAVQYISSVKYVPGKRFVLPRRLIDNTPRGYEIFDDEGLVKCFYGSPNGEVGLNRWNIPDNARVMEFMEMEIGGVLKPGAPVFYDREGNLLKIGNR